MSWMAESCTGGVIDAPADYIVGEESGLVEVVSSQWPIAGRRKQTSVVLLPQCVKPCGEISFFGRSSLVHVLRALIAALGCAVSVHRPHCLAPWYRAAPVLVSVAASNLRL